MEIAKQGSATKFIRGVVVRDVDEKEQMALRGERPKLLRHSLPNVSPASEREPKTMDAANRAKMMFQSFFAASSMLQREKHAM
ncbi:hypothetical protein [Bradyrhizobium sp.]|uniref:hypothetical protein n=1 Tax=Bradyrhizobium sp. TaxID=376 RepID=UPI003C4ABD92